MPGFFCGISSISSKIIVMIMCLIERCAYSRKALSEPWDSQIFDQDVVGKNGNGTDSKPTGEC